MKKFFRMLLLAAVALMPVMGMAQDNNERDYAWERQMRSQEYADSVKAAQQEAEFEHAQSMAQIKNSHKEAMIRRIWDEDFIVLFILVGGVITIVRLCLRHSRKKAEDHKELINKLIENNLLNSSETISKDAIEALMNPKTKKSDKDKIITDATLVGLGFGLGFASSQTHGQLGNFLAAAATVLLFLGALRLVIRAIFIIVDYFINKKKTSNTSIRVEEAEVVEEK